MQMPQHNDDVTKAKVLSLVRRLDNLYDTMNSGFLYAPSPSVFDKAVRFFGSIKAENAYKGMVSAIKQHASFPAVIQFSNIENDCNDPNITLDIIIAKYNMHITLNGVEEFNRHWAIFSREMKLQTSRDKAVEDKEKSIQYQNESIQRRKESASTQYHSLLSSNSETLILTRIYHNAEFASSIADMGLDSSLTYDELIAGLDHQIVRLSRIVCLPDYLGCVFELILIILAIFAFYNYWPAGIFLAAIYASVIFCRVKRDKLTDKKQNVIKLKDELTKKWGVLHLALQELKCK